MSDKHIKHEALEPLVEAINYALHNIQIDQQMPRSSLRIWMPEYFNRMLGVYLYQAYGRAVLTSPPGHAMDEYRGIKVLDGYRNNIVIGSLHCAQMDIRPIMIIIP